jgi:pimeloyl-ACP methyl ester carboxylesterase
MMSKSPVEHGTVRLEEVHIHYVVAGPPDGQPVILLHGWPQHLRSWHRVIPVLSDAGYRVVAVDLRGSGGSTIAKNGYDKKTMAADVRAVVQQLGLGPVALVGNDHGAGVAYAYAAQYPREVTALAVMEYWMAGFGYEKFLQATPDWQHHSNWQLVMFTLPDIAEWAFRGRERELLAWFFWHAAANPSAVTPEDFEAYVRDYSRPGALRAGIEYYAAVWQDMEDNKLFSQAKLDVPTLGIGGVMSGAEHVAEALRPLALDVRTAVIPNAGHWVLDENPAAFSDVLQSFLAEAHAPGARPPS